MGGGLLSFCASLLEAAPCLLASIRRCHLCAAARPAATHSAHRTSPHPLLPQVIGTALALLLLSGGAIPLWGGVLLAAVSAYTMLFLERLGVRYLELVFQLFVAGACWLLIVRGGMTHAACCWLARAACGLAGRGAPAGPPVPSPSTSPHVRTASTPHLYCLPAPVPQ